MNSLNYSRRRALFTSSKGSYIRNSLGSRDSLESPDEDGDTSSISALSTQSTRSLKSYRSWRKLQKQRRQLKRAQTIGGFEAMDSTLDALDLSGEFGNATPSKKENGVFDEVTQSATSSINIKLKETSVDDKPHTVITTIPQSPLEPFYSSSSSLASSTSRSDEISTPRRTPRSESDIDEFEDSEIQKHFKESFKNNKTPLQRRSCPYIFQSDTLYSTPIGEQIGANYLVTNPLVFPSQERRSSAGEVPSLKSPPLLLELAKLKKATRKMSDTAYEQQETDELDVVFAETNGFTVSLPINSPTVPAHMLGDEVIEKGDKNDEYFFDKDPRENERIHWKMEASKRRQIESERKQNNLTDSFDNPDSVPHQIAVETNSGSYFLPPLIAKAIEKHNASVSEDTSRLFERDKNSNLKFSEKNKGTRAASSASSTQEATDDENVYMENADDIFDDLRERDYLNVPGQRALPETDTSSITTWDSIDPIENILVREDPLPADDRTFTLNGKAIITPKPDKQVEEHVEVVALEAAEAPAPETYKDLHDLVATKNDETSDTDTKSSQIHSHKVGEDSKCNICNNINNTMPTVVEETEFVAKSESQFESGNPEQVNDVQKTTKPIHSHKVGDDANCEHCSPRKEGEANVSDIAPDLCCSIL
uniref:uncharacterized protein LOC120337961 n=1 Tax=Styela clava TaxID=7725 RepID=UPI001939F0C2|nr:uncharacterized protein LOC120337961 [Styela clava]